MLKTIAALVVAVVSLGAHADDLKSGAVAGQAMDVASTAAGLALGAAEVNPLGLLTLGAKAVAYERILSAHPTEQPALWSAYGAFGLGATANNVCVIAAIASGGASAALCPLIGMAAGFTTWNLDEESRNRATFDALCKQQQTERPELECIYTAAGGGSQQ